MATATVILKANPVDGGVVTGGASGLNTGDKVTITASPHVGYIFKQWNDGNTEQEREITIPVLYLYDQTFTYTAEFSKTDITVDIAYLHGLNDLASVDRISYIDHISENNVTITNPVIEDIVNIDSIDIIDKLSEIDILKNISTINNLNTIKDLNHIGVMDKLTTINSINSINDNKVTLQDSEATIGDIGEISRSYNIETTSRARFIIELAKQLYSYSNFYTQDHAYDRNPAYFAKRAINWATTFWENIPNEYKTEITSDGKTSNKTTNSLRYFNRR